MLISAFFDYFLTQSWLNFWQFVAFLLIFSQIFVNRMMDPIIERVCFHCQLI